METAEESTVTSIGRNLRLARIFFVVVVMFGSTGSPQALGQTAAAAMPATTAGNQLGWLLDALNGAGPALTKTSLAAHFSPEFLTALPVD